MRRVGDLKIDATSGVDGVSMRVAVAAGSRLSSLDTEAGRRAWLDRQEVEQLREACDDFLEGRRL